MTVGAVNGLPHRYAHPLHQGGGAPWLREDWFVEGKLVKCMPTSFGLNHPRIPGVGAGAAVSLTARFWDACDHILLSYRFGAPW